MSRTGKTRTSSGQNRRASKRPQTVLTRMGRLVKLGVNEWGKPLVQCPRCGGTAVSGRTGEVWCRECGLTSAELSGCG